MNNRVRPSPNTKTLCPWYRFATNGLLLRKAHGRSRISSARRKPTIFDAVSRLGE